MTLVLDASPLIEIFTRGPCAAEVRDLLKREPGVVSSSNLAEVAYKLARGEEISVEDVRRFVEPRVAGIVAVVDATEEHAWRAADLRDRHYHARRRDLSLADCFLLATAEPGADTIVTADHAVAEVARAEGIDAHVLAGRRP